MRDDNKVDWNLTKVKTLSFSSSTKWSEAFWHYFTWDHDPPFSKQLLPDIAILSTSVFILLHFSQSQSPITSHGFLKRTKKKTNPSKFWAKLSCSQIQKGIRDLDLTSLWMETHWRAPPQLLEWRIRGKESSFSSIVYSFLFFPIVLGFLYIVPAPLSKTNLKLKYLLKLDSMIYWKILKS